MKALADFLTDLAEFPAVLDITATVLLLLLLLLARSVVARAVARSDLPLERRRSMLVQTRNLAAFAFVGGAAVIWAQQLQHVALSLAAIAVAIVIATKELLLCFSGALLRISAQGWSIGDRIETGGIRGDVIDIGALTTTILEIGPGPAIHKATGRTIVLPNSLFLTQPVTNESFTHDFVLHATTVPLREGDDWEHAERCLLAAARTECEGFLDEARKNMERVGRKHGLEPPSVAPQVWVRLPKAGRVELVLRFPAPSRIRGQTEQAILRKFLTAFDTSPSSP
jgi:small-conductance mechanosensitive channel